MLRLGKGFSITKISAIQAAALSALFFAIFITSYSSMAATDTEMGEWENTKIRQMAVFNASVGMDSYEVAEAQITGVSRQMELEDGCNKEVISPEAQLLMDKAIRSADR